MEERLNKGKEVLKILISNGYEAYFIGGVVRSNIAKLPFEEIDITTSATPTAIKGIFDFTKVEEEIEGTIKVTYNSEVFHISTFRADNYKDRRDAMPVHYSKNLLDDLAHRDFTINAIAMSHSGKLTDAYHGYEDILKKRIRTIGKANIRFSEDPIRMLRAIRFISELGFKIGSKEKKAIKSKARLIARVDEKLIIKEVDKCLKGKFYKKAFSCLIDTKLYKYIPFLNVAFKAQYRNFKKLSGEELLLLASCINKTTNENYMDIVQDNIKFNNVLNLFEANPKSKYGTLELYTHGLDACLLANKMSHILKKSPLKVKKITKNYNNLVIKKVCDLKFKGEDILKLTNNVNGEFVQVVCDRIVYKVLMKELENDYDKIKVFALEELKTMNIEVSNEEKIDYHYTNDLGEKLDIVEKNDDEELVELNKNLEYSTLVNATSEDEIEETLKHQGQVIKDYTEHRIDMLERRINEQDRIIREKDMKYAAIEKQMRQSKIKEDIDKMVNNNLEMLKELNYLDNSEKDKVELGRRLHKVYLDFINDIDDKYTTGEENEEN